MQSLTSVREILFPSRCLGCRALDCRALGAALCSSCQVFWKFGNFKSKVADVPVFSSVHYNSVASHILLSAKEDGIRRGDDLLLSALVNSFRNLAAAGLGHGALVPIPSTAQANRKRGRNFVHHLSLKLSEIELLPVWDLLEHARKIEDQSRLTPQQRQQNLAGSMKMIDRGIRGRQVILVDDLLTTGATLGEAVRTLEARGTFVVSAITAFLALPIR